MARDRSSDVSAAYRKLMREDTPGEKLVRVWIWEYVLKFTSDKRLIRELTDSLAFPKDVPRLKHMILLKELCSQVSKSLDLKKTLDTLEALLHASTKQLADNAGAESEDGASDGFAGERAKQTQASTLKGKVKAGSAQEKALREELGEEWTWKGLRQPIEELKLELQQLLTQAPAGESEAAQRGKIKEFEKRLKSLIGSAWAALGPVFLEKTEAAVMSGLYKPHSVTTWQSQAANVGHDKAAGKEADKQVDHRESRQDLERARQALVDSCTELQKVVKDPLPAFLRRGDGAAEPPSSNAGKEDPPTTVPPSSNAGKEDPLTTAPAVAKRSLLDPHPSARAQGWDDDEHVEDEIEESPPDNSPSASGRVRLPPFPSPKRTATTLPPRSEPAAAAEPPPTSVTTGHLNRRKRKKWSDLEVETLKREVQKYGKGRWKMILRTNFDVLHGRTEVDIKDKWRNLEKYEGIRIGGDD